MAIINLQNSPHKFQKKNLFTLSDSKGPYDYYKCLTCGIEGKRRSLNGTLDVKDSYSKDKIEKCTNVKPSPILVEITKVNAVGKQFSNLKPKTQHAVIEPPKEYKIKFPNSFITVWVMGNGEIVRLLSDEFIIIK